MTPCYDTLPKECLFARNVREGVPAGHDRVGRFGQKADTLLASLPKDAVGWLGASDRCVVQGSDGDKGFVVEAEINADEKTTRP